MAASTAHNSRCTICDKATSTFQCRGCAKDFCMHHTSEHRQELAKQIDEDIIPVYDQLRQNFDEHKKQPNHPPLIKQIDEWEQVSIEKIHQAASNARKQLSNVINKNIEKINLRLELLTQQLKTARDNDQFFERDLKQWKNQLDELKRDLITPRKINIQYDNNPNSFISQIHIVDIGDILEERFQQSFGNMQILNHGTVVTHNQTSSHTLVHGRREYLWGEHRLRFVIEKLSVYKWVFLGIVSKNAPAPRGGSTGETSYGFSGANNVWLHGTCLTGLDDYKSDFEKNDIIELLINCDQRTIRLTNERTRSSHILDVNIANCPFPWKLNVGLFHCPGERIRILS